MGHDYLRAIRETGFARIELLSEQSDRGEAHAPYAPDAGEDWHGAVLSITVLAVR